MDNRTTIDRDTPIMPYLVAETVVDELTLFLTHDAGIADRVDESLLRDLLDDVGDTRDGLLEELMRRADAAYRSDLAFAGKVTGKGDSGRDYLETSMRVWLASDLSLMASGSYVSVVKELPGFANGEPLPSVGPSAHAVR